MPTPTASAKIKVYASHAFSDRERVDDVMKQCVPSVPLSVRLAGWLAVCLSAGLSVWLAC